MTRCKLLKTIPVSLDGIHVTLWAVDDVHAVPDSLIGPLIAEGAIEILEDKALNPRRETKPKTRRKPKGR